MPRVHLGSLVQLAGNDSLPDATSSNWPVESSDLLFLKDFWIDSKRVIIFGLGWLRIRLVCYLRMSSYALVLVLGLKSGYGYFPYHWGTA